MFDLGIEKAERAHTQEPWLITFRCGCVRWREYNWLHRPIKTCPAHPPEPEMSGALLVAWVLIGVFVAALAITGIALIVGKALHLPLGCLS